MVLNKVTYNTAILAYEAGFDWPCTHGVDGFENYFERDFAPIAWNKPNNPLNKQGLIAAPEQELLQKWFRDVHSVEISIIPMKSSRKTKRLYEGHIFLYNQKSAIIAGGETLPHLQLFSNYEDCLEATLQESFNWV